ncbi:hypothetical protein WA538_003753 [Blastocystis sp. DL]
MSVEPDDSDSSRPILAVCENRAHEVGIALIDLNRLHTLQMGQFVDTTSYSYTLTLVKQEQPTLLLFPTSQKGSQLHLCLEKACTDPSPTQLMIVARKYFDETEGQCLVKERMSEGHGLNLDQDMEKKYLALAAACCVYKYLEFNQSTLLHPHTVSVEWREVTDVLHLSYRAITHLELLFGAQTASPRQSLFAVINHTHTVVGNRLLRTFLLTPSADLTTLNARLDFVDTLLRRRDLLADLGAHLARYGDINDVLFSLAVKLPEPSVRVAVRTVRSLLRLRHDLDLLVALAALLQPLRGSLAQALVAVFADPQWRQLATTLDAYLDVAKDISALGGTQKHQLCLCLRTGLSAALDVGRSVYLQALDDTRQLAEQVAQEAPCELRVACNASRGYYLLVSSKERPQLPELALFATLSSGFIELRKERGRVALSTVDLLSLNRKCVEAQESVYRASEELLVRLLEVVRESMGPLARMTEAVALLDVLCSHATLVASSASSWCRPRFNKGSLFALKQAWHPLAAAETAFVPNDLLLSPLVSAQLVFGPNCSGKSTYLRQIGVICVLAQIGSYVPATYAQLPLLERLFVRMGNEESTEEQRSSFAGELEDVKAMCEGAAVPTLCLLDEFGKSTSVESAMALCWSLMEYLSRQRPIFTLLTTHLLPLAQLGVSYPCFKVTMMRTAFSETQARFSYRNVTVTMQEQEAAEATEEELRRELTQHYGLVAARFCGLPPSLVDAAQQLLPSIQVKTLRCDQSQSVATQLQQEIYQRLAPLNAYSSLRDEGVGLEDAWECG